MHVHVHVCVYMYMYVYTVFVHVTCIYFCFLQMCGFTISHLWSLGVGCGGVIVCTWHIGMEVWPCAHPAYG